MSRAIYTLLLYLIQPVVLCRLLAKSRKVPGYRKRIFERYGFFPYHSSKSSIWVHTVSVGETIAAAPMIKRLVESYPQYQVVVTTMTPTGSKQVSRLFGDDVFHVYIPYDLPDAITRFLKKIRPVLVIFMETELWPNILRACKRQKVAVMLANARLSVRSAKRYGKIAGLTGEMLSAIDTLAAQHQDDAKRFLALGIDRNKVTVTGSLKYDLELPENIYGQGEKLRRTWLENKSKNTRIIIAASTHRGEESILLPVFMRLKEKYEDILFVVAPRHPERAGEILSLCKENDFTVARRSLHEKVEETTSLILADTLGEMPVLLNASDIVFMGGSLVPAGGHNFMEPASLALPIISGPHVFNFQHVADRLIAAKAMYMASDSENLEQFFSYLLDHNEKCREMGENAVQVVRQEQGALDRHMQLIHQILK